MLGEQSEAQGVESGADQLDDDVSGAAQRWRRCSGVIAL